jgi:hypothetical protein
MLGIEVIAGSELNDNEMQYTLMILELVSSVFEHDLLQTA